MNTKEAKSQRLLLINKWRNTGRRSLSRERSTTPELLQDIAKKKVRKTISGRENLFSESQNAEAAEAPTKPGRGRSKSSTTPKELIDQDEKENASIPNKRKSKSEVKESIPSPSPEPTNNNNSCDVNSQVTVLSVEANIKEEERENINQGNPEHLETSETELIKTEKGDQVLIVDDPTLPLRRGDIVWAYISGYPLWPSLITVDPLENQYTKIKFNGKNPVRYFHVEFFGDNGSRSWLTGNVLFPFEGGVEQLLSDKDGFGKHVRSKNKIFKSLQLAIKSARKNWQTALDEAKESLAREREERFEFFRKIVQVKGEEQKKRKRKESLTENREKQPKRRRQSKESSLDDGASVETSSTTNEAYDFPVETAPSEASEPTDDQTDEAANNSEESGSSTEAKMALKKREKKNPEMKIEVCETCGTRDGQLLACTKCKHFFHVQCVHGNAEVIPAKEAFLCSTCDPSLEPACCLCRKGDSELLCCNMKNCNLRYHRDCLKGFHTACSKQEKLYSQFNCPAHYCHTCVAEVGELHPPEKKLIRCIQCPTSYHAGERCLAAGSVMLSLSQMRCFKHAESRTTSTAKKSKKDKKSLPTHYNVNWCMVCSEGGTLICCERCPAAFHTRCVGLEKEPDGSYLCPECTTGKTVLHGDIVWIKMSVYRWWPGRVYPIEEVPEKHRTYQPNIGEFLVYFYGSRNSAYVYRGQVFHYQDEDQGCKVKSMKNKLGDDFKLALTEVGAGFRERQLALAEHKSERQAKVNLKPPPYNRIRTNKPIGKVRVRDSGLNAQSRCECDVSQERPCSSDTDCLNRMLQFECHPNTCPGKEKCENQRFQKRQSPRLYAFNTGGKGWGLKSSDPIKKGDFVIEYVGELIDNAEFRRRLKAKQDAHDEAYYFLTLDNSRMIDAGPSGNLARFMNHSCQPNCETQKWTVLGDIRIGLFAIDDIPPDTELTFNYHLECAYDVDDESQQRKQPCNCGAPNCGGYIGAKPKQIKNDVNKNVKVKREKKKRQRKPEKEKTADDHCFRCYEGGRLVMCDLPTCPKVYHVECLNLSFAPKGKWMCPWHHCDVCGGKSTQFCSVCPNSLCLAHAPEANMTRHDELGLLCNEHSEEDIAFVIKRLAEEEQESHGNSSPEPSSSLSETNNS